MYLFSYLFIYLFIYFCEGDGLYTLPLPLLSSHTRMFVKTQNQIFTRLCKIPMRTTSIGIVSFVSIPQKVHYKTENAIGQVSCARKRRRF